VTFEAKGEGNPALPMKAEALLEKILESSNSPRSEIERGHQHWPQGLPM